MSEEQTGLIRVQEADFEEVSAQHVDFFLTIKGASLIVGDAALNKAREVQQLVTELKTIGATEADIKLLGVQADVSTGILGRNSSATYSLKVHCERLEALPDFLGVITSQKNTSVTYLQWDYGTLREVQLHLLDRCIERANEKAQRIATALNVTLAGVHSFTDAMTSQEGDIASAEERMEVLSRRLQEQGVQGRGDVRNAFYGKYDLYDTADRVRRVTVQELGMQISHSKQVIVGVNIEYVIGQQERPQNDTGSETGSRPEESA